MLQDDFCFEDMMVNGKRMKVTKTNGKREVKESVDQSGKFSLFVN